MKLLREGKSFSGHERNCAYLNCGQSAFANISSASGLDFADDGRAVGVTDWDQDGDLDVWFHNRTGPRLRLMRNRIRDRDDNTGTNYIAFRLRGSASNRDGIGARITVFPEGDALPQVQTLHAGDAFLSQSSKWLHFGVGDHQKVRQVTVKWPNGRRQTFGDVDVNRRYLVEEDATSLSELPITNRDLAIVDRDQPKFSDASTIRTVLSNRLPLPLLPYTTLDGDERTVNSFDKTTLIVLWASWCPACRDELSAMAAKAEELQDAGVDVLLIAVDGLDQEHQSGTSDVKLVLDDLGVSFAAGIADRDFLAKLELAESVILNRPPRLAVPLNLLVDQDGSLAVIYRGPIEVSQVIRDVHRLDGVQRLGREQAVPFAGRWTSPPRQILVRAVGHLFEKSGFKEDHARYLRLDTEMLERQRQLAKSDDQRQQIDRQYAAANYNLGVALVAQNENARAFEYFQRAVSAHPEHVDAMVNLAVLYARQRKGKEAVELLRRAIAIDPDSYAARLNLANAMSAAGAFVQAIEQYQHVIDQGLANTAVYSRLARALLEVGRVGDAVEQLQAAVDKGANDTATLVSLAWIRATAGEEMLRDGDQAVHLASQLRKVESLPLFVRLDLDAAANAEIGNFEEAVRLGEQAAQSLGDEQVSLKAALDARLSNYRRGLPFRDQDGRYP